MRISLLLKREPFGQILADTIGHHSAIVREVTWHERKSRIPSVDFGTQVWFGNIYLNFFATRRIARDAFAVMRREYSRSTRWWRRPAQAAYVHMATSPRWLAPLAHVALSIRPPIDGDDDTLILGGNRRLRLLHPAAGESTVILKRGFDPEYIMHEIVLRQRLEPESAPKLISVSPDGLSYKEEYFVGTPSNRMPRQIAAELETRAHKLLAATIRRTLAPANAADHFESILVRVAFLAAGSHVSESVRNRLDAIVAAARDTAARLITSASEVATAWCHGDFQPANILVGDTATVRIIDWECAKRRFSGYDPLVFACQSRTTLDFSKRVKAMLQGLGNWPSQAIDWPGTEQTLQGRRFSLLFFLAEELCYVLEDNLAPAFIRPDPALPRLLAEIERGFVALR